MLSQAEPSTTVTAGRRRDSGLITEALDFGAIKHPDASALVFEGATTSYGELAARSRRTANAMLDLASPGDRIVLLAQNCPEYVDCLYGVPRAGLALCLLNYRLHPREIVKIINDAQPVVVVVERQYLGIISAVLGELTSVRTVVSIGAAEDPEIVEFTALVSAASEDAPQVEVDPDAMVWLIYTSGTTGMAKGAMLSHRNVLAGASNTVVEWANHGGRTLLTPWPMCHVAAMILPSAHRMGWCVVLMRAFDTEAFLDCVQRYRCTTVMGAPTMLNMVMQHPQFGDYDLSSVRIISYGSAPMPADVLRQAMELWPGVGWETNFGMTELSGAITYFNAQQHRDVIEHAPGALASVGRQMMYGVCRIVDRDMNDLAPGEIGEVVVRGAQVMLGYWQRPEATVEAFRGGWFHTGDLARADDAGRIYIVDRVKDMIITGGENVYSREVEEIIYQHPAVSEAAVVGVPDVKWGENVVAVIQLRPGMRTTEAEIISLCREHLAGYKKPRHVLFLDELPRNATGKILKRDLRTVAIDAVGSIGS